MGLAEFPLLFVLLGLTAYAVLGGADFGAGFGSSQRWAARARTARARSPLHGTRVGGDHVWLIFVLVIFWTAYPVAFGSIASTLAAPLYIAAVGMILRGTAYALRSAARSEREAIHIDLAFALSSILTPFALGTMVGAIASERVPVGTRRALYGRAGSTPRRSSSAFWPSRGGVHGSGVPRGRRRQDRPRRPCPGVPAARTGSRFGDRRTRAGRADRAARRPRGLFDGLTTGPGTAALTASAGAGLATLTLLWRSAFEPARFAAAAAVAAIVAGWAVAQQPTLLPNLTVQEAAAGRATLVAILVGVLAGSLILIPSLALLFRMVLGGTFDPQPEQDSAAGQPPIH